MSAQSKRLLLIRAYIPLKGGGPVPPMGLLYLGAAVRAAFGERWEVRLWDTGLTHPTEQELTDGLDAWRPDVVGISAMSCEAEWLHTVAKLVRRRAPDAGIVVGGPHAVTAGRRILDDPAVDVVVPGEGERALVDLLAALEDPEPDLDGVDGILYRKDGAVRRTADRELEADLDALPRPAFDLVDLKAYGPIPNWNGVRKQPFYAPLVTSRGCPYGCTFCHNVFGRRVRLRAAEQVVDEIITHHDTLGVREFHVLDDIFNVNERRAKAICRGIIDSGRKVSLAFPNGLRADRMTDELLALMVEAGTYKVNYGFESAVPRLQELTQKKLDLPKAQEMIAKTAKTKIITGAYFMLGLPTETEDEMRQTIEYAARSPLDVAYFFKATSYPGTPIFEAEGDTEPESFADYHFFSVGRSHGTLPAEQLNDLLLEAQHRFFLRPRRLWRSFWKWPNKREFVRNLLQMFSMLIQGHLLRKLVAAAPDKPAITEGQRGKDS